VKEEDALSARGKRGGGSSKKESLSLHELVAKEGKKGRGRTDRETKGHIVKGRKRGGRIVTSKEENSRYLRKEKIRDLS